MPSSQAQSTAPKRYPSNPRPPDLSVSLCFSHECTLRCAYCYTRELDRTRMTMSKSVLDRALDFLKHEFCPDGMRCGLFLGLTGEPLLHLDRLRDIREYVAEQLQHTDDRIYLGRVLITNCTTGIEQVVSDPYWRNHLFYASVDGPPHIHDSARSYPDGRGSHEQVLVGARALLDTGRLLGVSSVLSGLHPDVKGIFEYLRELGFSGISIKPARVKPTSPFAITPSNVDIVKQRYTSFADYLRSLSGDQLLSVLLSFSKADFFYRFLDRILTGDTVQYRCPAGRYSISIDPEGRILPCMAFAGLKGFDLGSIYAGLDSKRLRVYWNECHVDRNSRCRNCDIRYICGGCCYYQSALVTGRADQPDPSRCELVRHIANLAQGVADMLRERESAVLSALALPVPGAAPSRPKGVCMSLPGSASRDWCAWLVSRDPDIQLNVRQQVKRKTWGGPSDLSADVWLAWNPRCFHIVTQVRDDVLSQPFTEELLHLGDSLRVVISDASRTQFSSLCMAVTTEGNAILELAADRPARTLTDAELEIRRDDGVTTYICRVPWAEMLVPAPQELETRLFGVVVSDNDGHPHVGWIEWSSGVLPNVFLSRLGYLQFVEL